MDRTGEVGIEGSGAGHAAWARELVAAVGGVDHPLAQVPIAGLPAVVGGLAAWAQSAEWQRALDLGASDGIAGDGIADFVPAWQTEGAQGAGGEPPLDPARARPTPWSSQVRRHFDDWAGADGFLADDELAALMRDPRVVGDAAAALAVVHARADEIAALSDDEWGLEDDGMTLADLAAYEERAGNGRGAGFDGIYRGFAERLRATPAALFAQPDGRVDASAARQGAITDCWFIAAVVGRAAAAPESVAKMISEDPDGRLTVRFPGAGAVTIDRPTDAEVARYSTAGRDGRWLAALEKAYARQRSGADAADPYAAIDSPSLASTGITPLTTGGTDHDLLGLTRRSVTRAKLTAALSARRIVTASVKMPNTLGLPIGHIYTVMAFDGATVTVRNPWGEGGGRRDTDRDGIVTLSLAEFDDVFFDITYETGATAGSD